MARSRHREQRVDDGAVNEAEVAGVDWNVDVRNTMNDAVKERRRPSLEAGLARALLAHPVDDLVARPPLFEHGGDDLGRVLQVGVEDDRTRASRKRKARADGFLMAEVARESRGDHVRVFAMDRLKDRVGVIERAVVDVEDLVVFTGAGEHCGEPGVAHGEHFLLVVAGHNHAQHGCRLVYFFTHRA
jgi:hypothetical protein